MSDSHEQEQQLGKVRVKPHISGNWACHVYLAGDIQSSSREILSEITQSLQGEYPSLRLEPDIHISLSRTFYAKHWQLDTIQRKFSLKLKVPQPDTVIAFDKFSIYNNESETRTFLALDCSQGSTEIILPLISIVDNVLSGFGFEKYYSEPKPHASILWSPMKGEFTKVLFDHPDLKGLNVPIIMSNVRIALRMGNRILLL